MNIAPHEIQEQVAAEVRAEMARQRLTLRDVAGKIGMVHTSLHRRLTGKIPFDVGELARMADVLNVPVIQFFPDRNGDGVRRRSFITFFRSFRVPVANYIGVITQALVNEYAAS